MIFHKQIYRDVYCQASESLSILIEREKEEIMIDPLHKQKRVERVDVHQAVNKGDGHYCLIFNLYSLLHGKR